MNPPTQRRRHIAIATPLGEDVLLLNRFTFRERLSSPFEIEADLSSVDPNIDYRKIVGYPVAIRLHMGEHGTRYFHGHVSRFVQVAGQGHFARYRATIVPWIWFLTRTSDCRVFQRKSVLDIAEDVFNGHRFGSEFYDIRLKERYPKRRYCVQYRETDFNYVSRLLESEGIYYWFDHTKDRHRLVLADGIGASKPVKGFEKLKFNVVDPGAAEGRTDISEWIVQQEVQPVSYRLKDFDFKKPSDPLMAGHDIPREHAMARFAMYDYPGEYYDPKEAKRYAQLRLEELQAGFEVLQGVTGARGLAAGTVFELTDHPRDDQNRKYLVTELNLTADAGEFESRGGQEEFCSCHFAAIPAKTPYRPPRATPKPVIQGIQTATVVGPKKAEIHVDKHGRVKVHFHWDRYGKPDDEASCWVRVSQYWAGKEWGSVHTPRIGQEVLVDFLEGDPDRPIIVGRVYNAEQPPPYALPANKTQSGIKSRSTEKGTPGNFNEIRFEDKKGEEQLYIQAEKDKQVLVKNNNSESVGANESVSVGGSRSKSVASKETNSIGADRITQVGANDVLVVGANSSEKIAANKAVEAGANIMLKAGTSVLIEAGTSITLKCGASLIHMNQAGVIMIQGMMVNVVGAINTNVTAPLTTISGLGVMNAGVINLNAGVLYKIIGTYTAIDGSQVTIN